jgi:hypothetical protein
MEYAPGALDCWMALASDQKCEMKAFLFIKAASSIRLSVCLKLLQIYMLACPDCVRGAHCSAHCWAQSALKEKTCPSVGREKKPQALCQVNLGLIQALKRKFRGASC